GVVGFQASYSVDNDKQWLSVNPTTGTFSNQNPAILTVSVNLAGLPPGVYTGNINVSINSVVRSTSVTLIVFPAGQATKETEVNRAAGCNPSHVVMTQSGLANNFGVPAGWPETVSVLMTDDCGRPVANGSAVASFSNGDPALSLRSDQSSGTYSATWQ